jgi:hypothetical protein
MISIKRVLGHEVRCAFEDVELIEMLLGDNTNAHQDAKVEGYAPLRDVIDDKLEPLSCCPSSAPSIDHRGQIFWVVLRFPCVID